MAAKMIRVADYIASRCVEAGAKHVFLVTGGGAMHLNDAFGRNQQLEKVCFHHEQAAAIAAESYYRLTNRLAVLNVTTGPGGINALNGVYGAYVDSLGMLVISGQVKRETFLKNYPIPLRQLGDQEVDIVAMAKVVTKYATVLQDQNLVRQVMDKAIFLSTFGRPGPVWVDVPVDIQGALIDPEKLIAWNPADLKDLARDPDLHPNTIDEVLHLGSADLNSAVDQLINRLKQSKRPVLLVGSGVRIANMHSDFLKLIEKLKIPVVTGWNAHDALENVSPYYCGRPGTVGDRAGNFAVQNADFLIVLGCRLNIRQVSYGWANFAPHAYKVMVDADRSEMTKPTLKIDLPIHATLQEFIPTLMRALEGFQIQNCNAKEHANYLQWCRERVTLYPVVTKEQKQSRLINPYVFMQTLFANLDRDDVVVTGNGSACVISFQAADLKEEQRLYTNSGNASMGYDLPAAIGACIARGAKRVICLAGDGSLMMNLQELQTVVGYRLPIKVIVLNNQGYHSIRQTQEAYFADSLIGIGPDTGVTIPDFVELGKAFGIPSLRGDSHNQMNGALNWLLQEQSGFALLEVMLDITQSFSPKLASRKLPDGRMVSPALDDMAPFLSREELAKNRLV
jgi:acetolactate synthase-1/2/3 large subunit